MGIVNFCHKKPIPNLFCKRAADLYSTKNGAPAGDPSPTGNAVLFSFFCSGDPFRRPGCCSRSGPQSSTTRRPSTSRLRCWFTVRYSSTTSRAEVDSTRILPFFSTSSSVMSKNGLRLL